MDLKSKIDKDKLPRHVAIIMDGNGRWAKEHSKPRIMGHRHGVKSVKEVTEAAAELGVEYLTLYAFSTENWKRPKLEVNALMTLLVETLHKEIASLHDNNVRLQAIGDIKKLPKKSYEALIGGIEKTKGNERMDLILALNYSGRWEIVEATKQIARKVQEQELSPSDISDDTVKEALSTADYPDPELLIRTSGENRISNFLLWQIAYSELYFSPVFWPDFRKDHFYQAIIDFQNRERRFGKISEQIV